MSKVKEDGHGHWWNCQKCQRRFFSCFAKCTYCGSKKVKEKNGV